MTPPLPDLMEELVEEVLLRFLPDDPASLVHAALVCKLWCRLVSGTAFRRRFREFHSHRSAAAPLLGVICTGNCKLGHDTDDPSLKPTRAMPSPMAAYHGIVSAPDGHKWVATDARHGRVLLYKLYPLHYTIVYSVWNPVTNVQWHLPELPFNICHDYSSTVVCAATASGNCDHLDCHRRGPFLVVVMEILDLVMKLSVYSSETGAWSQLADFKLDRPRRLGCFAFGPVVLAGSALYLLVRLCDEVVKYDLATREVSAIPLPSEIRRVKVKLGIELIADDDGEIGFVSDKRYYKHVNNWDPAKVAASTSSGSPPMPVPRPKRRRKPNPKYVGPAWTA